MSRNRFTLLALLSGRAHDYAHLARPLLHSLERMHHFDVEVTDDFGALNEGRARVLLAASDVPVDRDQAARLNEFVRRGGGVVLLHGTLAMWSEQDAVAEMAGWRLGQPAPLTELVIRVADHPVTERLTPEVRVEDELYVSEGPPADANALMRASWRFSEQVVAYERQHGDGRFVQIGLGHGAATYQQPDFQKLVHRAILFASGAPPAPKVGIGLIGYGAIARGHAESASAISGLDVRAVCDISPERRELAARELGVKTYSSAGAGIPTTSRCAKPSAPAASASSSTWSLSSAAIRIRAISGTATSPSRAGPSTTGARTTSTGCCSCSRDLSGTT